VITCGRVSGGEVDGGGEVVVTMPNITLTVSIFDWYSSIEVWTLIIDSLTASRSDWRSVSSESALPHELTTSRIPPDKQQRNL
jgi:hypothetical protein